jgi:hypothetical protein
MAYQYNSPTSFTLSDSGTYSIPSQITAWQTRQMSAILGGLLSNCKGMGSSLVTAALAYATGDGKDGQNAFQTLFSQIGGKDFASDLTGGLGELLAYNGKENVTGQILATLYLKENEAKVEKMEERIALFDTVPISQLQEGVGHFFASKRESSKNTPSHSATIVPTNSAKRPSRSKTLA